MISTIPVRIFDFLIFFDFVVGDTSLLKDCGIQTGDVIIVEELRSGHSVNGKSTSSLPSM